MPDDAILVERILGEIVPIGAQLGIRCVQASVDEVRLVLDPSSLAWNHLGTVYAGAIFALAELTAGALAALGAKDLAIPVLVSSHLDFVRPASGPIECTAVPPVPELFACLGAALQRDHRAATTLTARCDADGSAVAHADFTYRWLVSDRTPDHRSGSPGSK